MAGTKPGERSLGKKQNMEGNYPFHAGWSVVMNESYLMNLSRNPESAIRQWCASGTRKNPEKTH
jgi:hypothetical protein